MTTWAIAAVTVLALGGCNSLSKERFAGLTVVAPEYLKGTVELAAEQFQQENKTRVRIVFEPADRVLRRAASDKETDLFIIGDPSRPENREAIDSILWDGFYSCPFQASLLLVGRPNGPARRTINELAADDIQRVVIVDTSLYEGKLAAAVLRNAGVLKRLHGRLIIARSVDQMLSYLHSGEADAAIALELSLRHDRKLVFWQALSDDEKLVGKMLWHCGGVTVHAANKDVARAFLDLFDSAECKMYRTRGVYANLES